MRKSGGLAMLVALASCVAPPRPASPPPPPAAPARSLPAAPPQQDWRDVPLTPGKWTWRGSPGHSSIAQYGQAGGSAIVALRCDLARATVVLSRAGSLPSEAGSGFMVLTTSFGTFQTTAHGGTGAPPAILSEFAARDPRLDQIAFSRGRFLIDVAKQPRLVLPAWPEVARVIEDCRP